MSFTKSEVLKYFLLAALPILIIVIPLVWHDEVDPAFVKFEAYIWLTYTFLIFFSLAITVIFIALSFYLYQTNEEYRAHIQSNGRKETLFGFFVMPFMFYGFLYCIIVIPIEIYTYYSADLSWSEGYIVTKVSDCPSDYVRSCSKLSVRSTETGVDTSFRWYYNKQEILKLQGRLVSLSGSKNKWGAIVESIDWPEAD